jgi:hypothetical protein
MGEMAEWVAARRIRSARLATGARSERPGTDSWHGRGINKIREAQ